MAINSVQTFQLSIAGIDTPEPLFATSKKVSMAYIQADPGNTSNVLIGDATNQFYVLIPGDKIEIKDEQPQPGASADSFDLNTIEAQSFTIGDKVNVIHY